MINQGGKIDMERPFEEEDIEDVRIIVKAKGKHWGLVPMEYAGKDRCDKVRKMCLMICLHTHEIVDTPLEDIKADGSK
jgi:hypothetical protein